MDAFFPIDQTISSLWWTNLTLVLLAGGLLFYGWLADRAIFEGMGRVRAATFDRIDAAIAGALALFFAVVVCSHKEQPTAPPTDSQMILGVIQISLIFFVFVAALILGLVGRHKSPREIFGLDRVGPAKIVVLAPLLLLMAYALIDRALALTRVILALAGQDNSSPQEIVRFLGGEGHGVARAVVAVSAVVIAPIQEEFIFRGYLYGVIKKYAGVGAGVVLNSMLFAGIHLHAPSFGALFTLAVCLTLAYDWTGSIFVPMAVHSLFNSLTVFSLLFGGGHS